MFDVQDDEHVSPRYSEEVDDFATAMKNKLIKRAHKGDFNLIPFDETFQKLKGELDELSEALDFGTADEVMDECLDVANYALFIFHKAKDLSFYQLK